MPSDEIREKYLILIGNKVKQERIKKGLTLEQLGLDVGLTRMQVHRIEKGYNITLITLLKLSIALNTKPEFLIKVQNELDKFDLECLVNTNKSNK